MKAKERKKARVLRQEGISLGSIAKKLNISKSTASLWVRDIPLSDVQKKQLKTREGISGVGKKKGSKSKKRQEMGEKKWKEYQKQRMRQKNINQRLKHPEKYVNRDQNIKIRLIKEKSGRCEKCGYNKCIGSLDFHHKNPFTKEFSISHTHKSYEKMKKEVEKCNLLCANCHREIHWEEGKMKRRKRIESLKQMAK